MLAEEAGEGGAKSEGAGLVSEDTEASFLLISTDKCCVLVVPSHAVAHAEAAVAASPFAFKIQQGSRYLGSFIGEQHVLDPWLQTKIDSWVHSVEALAGAAARYPQAAYTALERSVQQQWQFVQRTTPNISPRFEQVRQALTDTFLPALFGERLEADDPRLPLAQLPVRYSGLGLLDPVRSASRNYKASLSAAQHFLAATLGNTRFSTMDHASSVASAKSAALPQLETECET